MFKSLLILLLILTNNNLAKAEILTTSSINSTTIEKLNNWIDKDTIIFIEIDEVLVTPKSKMFRYNGNPYRSFIQNVINLSKENSKYLTTIAKWFQMRKIMLTEDNWENFINDLKKRDIPVYGFCTMPIHLENIEQYRLSELAKLGIKFTDKVNDKNILELNKQAGWKSVFYHGIIFTGPFSKSQTLLDFIEKTNISPKKIIVFDKIKSELQQIDSELRRFRIDVYNILYLGARESKDKPDPNIVKLQQKTLLEKNIWLEDEEAESMVKNHHE